MSRKPIHPYLRYYNEVRQTEINNHPGLLPIQISEIITRNWLRLPEELKAPYIAAYDAALEMKKFADARDNFMGRNTDSSCLFKELIENVWHPRNIEKYDGKYLDYLEGDLYY